MAKLYALAFIFFVTIYSLNAQSVSDSTFVTTASNSAVEHYAEFIKGQSALFTGTEYKEPRSTNEQHPFYPVNDWQWGEILYNGQIYEKAPFMYDIFNDVLITENFHNNEEIALVKEKVAHFTMGKKKFINIINTPAGLPSAGFYELHYNGPSQLLTRHEKKFEERIAQNRLEMSYKEKHRHFIRKGEQYHRVNSRRDLFKLMQDKRQQVRAFINQNNFLISKENPSAMARIAEYYDSLTAETR